MRIFGLIGSIILGVTISHAQDLKIYRNSEFKLQFSYPSLWKPTECDGTTQDAICSACAGCNSVFFGDDRLTIRVKYGSLDKLFSDEDEMFTKTTDGRVELAVPVFIGSEEVAGPNWSGMIFSYACSADGGRYEGVCYEAVAHRSGVSIILSVGNSAVEKDTIEQIMKSLKFLD